MSGSNGFNCSNGNSFDDSAEATSLVLWFRLAMPVPVTLVSGI